MHLKYSQLQCISNKLLLDTKIRFFLYLIAVLDLKLQPERPNNLYYSSRGSKFFVNCTVVVGNYTQALNLTWQHNKKWLFGEVQHIDTTTVQLTLSSTSSKNNGIYWCGPKLGHMSQGVNISLIVAGN